MSMAPLVPPDSLRDSDRRRRVEILHETIARFVGDPGILDRALDNLHPSGVQVRATHEACQVHGRSLGLRTR